MGFYWSYTLLLSSHLFLCMHSWRPINHYTSTELEYIHAILYLPKHPAVHFTFIILFLDHVMTIIFFRFITTTECPAYNMPSCTVSKPAYAQITSAQDEGLAYLVVDIISWQYSAVCYDSYQVVKLFVFLYVESPYLNCVYYFIALIVTHDYDDDNNCHSPQHTAKTSWLF